MSAATPSPPVVHRARTVQLGPLRVRVSTDSIDTAARWTNLLAGLADADPGAPPLEVTITRAGSNLHALVDGEELYQGTDPFALEIAVTRRLNERKLDAEPHLVHLHSAAVAAGGATVIIVGNSGKGKSTLTARLVQRGWQYVTDEQVTIRPDDRMVVPYARPITLRRAVWDQFDGLHVPGSGEEYRRVEVPLDALHGSAERTLTRPALIIAPQYSPTGSNCLVPIPSRAEVVRLLASCCYDLERTGTGGMDVLVHLADQCPAWRLEFCDLDAAADAVASALRESTNASPAGQRLIGPTTAHGSTGPLRRRTGVDVWQFADATGLAFDHVRLRFVNLDPLGVAVWEMLGSASSAAELVAAAPDERTRDAVEQWVEGLLGLGLLERFGPPDGRLSG